jgi:hypothetical protein
MSQGSLKCKETWKGPLSYWRCGSPHAIGLEKSTVLLLPEGGRQGHPEHLTRIVLDERGEDASATPLLDAEAASPLEICH